MNLFFKSSPKDIFTDFRERERRERVRKRSIWEKNISWLHPVCSLTRDRTHNPSMCPDWESNLQPFSVQENAPTKLSHPAKGRSKFFLFLLTGFRDRGRKGAEWGREEHQFIVPVINALIGWFLYVPWPGIKLATLAHWDDALTYCTLPGQGYLGVNFTKHLQDLYAETTQCW